MRTGIAATAAGCVELDVADDVIDETVSGVAREDWLPVDAMAARGMAGACPLRLITSVEWCISRRRCFSLC